MKLVIVLLLSTCCVITKGCSDTTIRQAQSNLVEMCFRGQWLSACASDDIWTDDLAVIACEELQLPSVEARAIDAGGETSSTDTVIVIGECNRTETLGECGITERTGGCLAPDIYIGVICSPLCEEALCNSSSCYPPLSTCHCPTLLRNATYPQDTQCQNGGTCNSGQCMCPPGWSGVRCEEDIIAMCTPPCSNGGTCTGTNTCQCPDNWEGLQCDNAKDSTSNDGLIAALVTVTVLLLVMVAVGILLGVIIHWRKKRKSHSLTDKDSVTHTRLTETRDPLIEDEPTDLSIASTQNDTTDLTVESTQNESDVALNTVPAESSVGLYDVIQLRDLQTGKQSMNSSDVMNTTESIIESLNTATTPCIYQTEGDLGSSVNAQNESSTDSDINEQSTQVYSKLNYLYSKTNHARNTDSLPNDGQEKQLSEQAEHELKAGSHPQHEPKVHTEAEHNTPNVTTTKSSVLGRTLPNLPQNQPSSVYYDEVQLPNNPKAAYQDASKTLSLRRVVPEYEEPHFLRSQKRHSIPHCKEVEYDEPDAQPGRVFVSQKLEPTKDATNSAKDGSTNCLTPNDDGVYCSIEGEKIELLSCTAEYSKLQWQVKHSVHCDTVTANQQEQLHSLYTEAEEQANNSDKQLPNSSDNDAFTSTELTESAPTSTTPATIVTST